MSQPHVLICDDEQGIRDSLTLILEDDYQLSYAKNGKEVVEVLKTMTPDLLVLDIKMPERNGLDALIEVKKVQPDLKILMVTGYESYDVAAEAIQRGASEYVTKPFKSTDVLDAVAKLLASSPSA